MNQKQCLTFMAMVTGHITLADASDHCSQKTVQALLKSGKLTLRKETGMLSVDDDHYQNDVNFVGN